MGIYSDFTTFFTSSEIIAFVSYLPVTPAWPVISESGPLPLDYSISATEALYGGQRADNVVIIVQSWPEQGPGTRLLGHGYCSTPHSHTIAPDKCQVCSELGELNADLSNIPC